MSKLVTGIGGIFFRAKDSQALALWYETHLGINSMQSSEVWEQESGPTVFAPFKQDTNYFGSHDQQFMVNFRVANLEQALEQLQAAEVKIDEKREADSFGKFAWIYDPEGNKIELWEPVDESK